MFNNPQAGFLYCRPENLLRKFFMVQFNKYFSRALIIQLITYAYRSITICQVYLRDMLRKWVLTQKPRKNYLTCLTKLLTKIHAWHVSPEIAVKTLHGTRNTSTQTAAVPKNNLF